MFTNYPGKNISIKLEGELALQFPDHTATIKAMLLEMNLYKVDIRTIVNSIKNARKNILEKVVSDRFENVGPFNE